MITRTEVRGADRLAEGLLSSSRAARILPMDAYTADDHVVMHFDLPGVDPGTIDVVLDRGVLGVTARRSQRQGDSDGAVRWLTRERFGGTFTRQVTLGDGLDAEGLSATYDCGVLTITVPVSERAKPRKITVGLATDQPHKVLDPAV